jgi:hypothetical protein
MYYFLYFASFIFLLSNNVNFVVYFLNMLSKQADELENVAPPTKEKTPPVEVPYHDKYLDKFKSMSSVNESLDVDSLKNSMVVEHTPLGNVAMYYDNKREAFVYYSDSVMPYRYLEVVARKYVITFKCKSVFIDMEDEINKAKTKIEEQELKQKQTEAEIKEEAKKKNVFANFKNYNKNTTKDSANKPSAATSTTTDNKKTEDLILKENANHYTCDGRYSNFIVLKKVDKTLVDKRLKMSFADFKKMQSNKTSS